MQAFHLGRRPDRVRPGNRQRGRHLLRLGAFSAGTLALAAGLWAPSASALPGPVSPAPAYAHPAPSLLPAAKGLGKRGAAGQATTSTNLVDHGGKVLAASHTYVIWWGSPGTWPSDVASGIPSLFQGLNSSGFLNTGAQYMRGAGISSAYQGAKVDTSAPPRRMSPTTLGSEIAKKYGTNLDSAGVYFVYTSNFPSGANFCAWHSFATVSGRNVAVAYMPNTTGVAGCDPGNLYKLSGSRGLRSLANVTSHEYMEAVTDTLPANGSYAWIDTAGSEIGDKCAWHFASPVTLSNGSVWELQEEWSNAASGCVQSS
jgi:hypothetical protein